MIPPLLLLIGIPGSGKSTWLKNPPIEYRHCIVVCPDDIRRELASDVSNQDVNTEAWDLAKRRTIAALKNEVGVILDATSVNTKYRQDFLAGLPDCRLLAKLFEIDPATACERIRKDLESGIDRANVPEYVVYRMYGEFLYTKKVIESEGYELIEKSIEIHSFDQLKEIFGQNIGDCLMTLRSNDLKELLKINDEIKECHEILDQIYGPDNKRGTSGLLKRLKKIKKV